MIVLAFSASAYAGDMTADELIAKHVAAIGGEKALKAVESVYLEGKMFMQGAQLDTRAYIIPPNKGFMEILMNGAVVGGAASNGKEAWQTQMGQTFYLEGEMKEKIESQMMLFPLLDYKDRSCTVEYQGEEMVKGKNAYKLVYATPTGDTTQYYFDTESFYIVKESAADAASNLSDYKKVGDVLFAHKITTASQQGRVMITYDSVATNVTIPDSLFVMPADAKPLPKMPGMPPAEEKEGK